MQEKPARRFFTYHHRF